MRRHAKAIVAVSVLLLTLALNVALASAAAPAVTIDPASEIGVTSAKASGEVNPEGKETSWHFEYATQADFSDAIPFGGGTLDESEPATAVEASLEGLSAETTYYLRLIASNEDGGSEAVAASFETDPATVPTLTVEPASAVTHESATISGEVDPEGGNVNPIGGPIPIFWQLQYALASNPGVWKFAAAGTIEGAQAESDPDPGEGIEVSADLANLEPDREYEFRLIANYAADREAESSTDSFETLTVVPRVSRPNHNQLGQGEVALAGFANARNSTFLDCHFEYGPSVSYGQSIPCESLPPTDNSPHAVRAELTGLTPGATYHYRLVATNTVGTTESADSIVVPRKASAEGGCPNAGRIGVGFLPNCRAWELVSPPDKNGGSLMPDSGRTRAAADGSAASFTSLQGFADARGSGVAFEYLSQRSADPNPGDNGWSTHAITPPQESSTTITGVGGGEPHYPGFFSANLDRAAFRAWSPLTADPAVAGARNLYVRDDLRTPGVGSYELASPCPGCADGLPTPEDGPFNSQGFSPRFAGASDDFRHLIYQDNDNRAVGAFGERPKLYEWDQGTLRLAGVLPNGATAERSVAGHSVFGNVTAQSTSRPISSDGSRINFTTPDEEFSGWWGDVYQRIGGRTTVQLNASELASPEPRQPAEYWDASTDGHRVFFTTAEKLTADASGAGNINLYMWERQETNEVQTLAVDAAGGSFTLTFNGAATAPIPYDASAATVQAALEALAGPGPEDFPPGPGEALLAPGSIAVSGGPGSAGGGTPYEIVFGGDLAGVNVPQLQADPAGLSGGAGTATVTTSVPVENLTVLNVDGEPTDSTNSVDGVIGASDDGHYVYFSSIGQLVAGKPTSDFDHVIHLWHDGDLSFVGRLKGFIHDRDALLDGTSLTLIQKQADVSADGHHLLFVSSLGDGLLSAHGGMDFDHGDCNGPLSLEKCTELYLYGAEDDELACVSCAPTGTPPSTDAMARVRKAVGGTVVTNYMSRALSDDGRYAFFTTAEKLVGGDANGVEDAYVYDSATGKASLLSSGRSKEPSYFLDSSAVGRDAFFVTTEQLSAWDVDRSYDLYDARVGGGFPEPPPTPPHCLGDACQPAPAVLGESGSASSSFQGPGNQAPKAARARCRGGQRAVRRNGKRRCAKKASRAKRGHQKTKARNANNHRRAGR